MSALAIESEDDDQSVDAQSLLDHLLTGESIRLHGYFLMFSEGVTWYTNPYGVDGALGNEPTLDMCSNFLDHISSGEVLGLTP